MHTFGLIGKTLSHSLSHLFFKEKFHQYNIQDADYLLFSLSTLAEVKELLQHPSSRGFNITIPYKTEIIPFLDELDSIALKVGAVNCVVKHNGRWIGFNTDVAGFEKALTEVRRVHEEGMGYFSSKNREASFETKQIGLVLGNGGASKAVCYTLKKQKIPYQIVSRKKTEKTITYEEVTEPLMAESYVIINTTPIGMYPNMNEKLPLPFHAINQNHIMMDLIYNPEETLFLREGRERGATVVNGMTMFQTQAEKSFDLFLLQKPFNK